MAQLSGFYSYNLVQIKKTDLEFNLNTSAIVGIVNHIRLNVDADYLPNGSLVNENLLDIEIKYNDDIISASYDHELNDYCFDLDLTDKIDNKPIALTVQVNEIDLVNPSIYEFTLECNYPSVSSFTELQSKLVANAEIIELTSDIEFNSNLIIPNSVYIIGNGYDINLNKHNIDIQDNSVKCESINFKNGASCFIQKSNSKLILQNCKFYNAVITDNYKGSVVSSNSDEVTTDIINCFFKNCHHTIYTGGDLNVNNSKALYNEWNDKLDIDYSAFLTAYDGNITVTNSTFDIDYETKSSEITTETIKFAQSLIGLSENCIFNGTNVNVLKDNNTLPFFSNQYNNKSHIWILYYYPVTESLVVSSPTLNNEDKCVCHTILGIDWVFKNNVQVTTPDKANNIRKIIWEE